MATVAQLHSNRDNALKSTGPRSPAGKARASRNAQRHGLFSANFFINDEEAEIFGELKEDLECTLSPVGPLETSLVERIAIGMWRQRRLNSAEGAMLRPRGRPRQLARQIRSEGLYGLDSDVNEDQLVPFDATHAKWCQAVLAEYEALDIISLADVERCAPRIHEQLLNDAEDSKCVEEYLADHVLRPMIAARISGSSSLHIGYDDPKILRS